jgi:hypothetical protein
MQHKQKVKGTNDRKITADNTWKYKEMTADYSSPKRAIEKQIETNRGLLQGDKTDPNAGQNYCTKTSGQKQSKLTHEVLRNY